MQFASDLRNHLISIFRLVLTIAHVKPLLIVPSIGNDYRVAGPQSGEGCLVWDLGDVYRPDCWRASD